MKRKTKILAYVRTNMNVLKHDANKEFEERSIEVTALLMLGLILLVM